MGTCIGLVHMAMYHDGRPPVVQQGSETLKPPVRVVILIPEATDRRVRQKDIEPPGRFQPAAESGGAER